MREGRYGNATTVRCTAITKRNADPNLLCGQCAGTHATLDCRQEIVKCARCDGPHRARVDTCSILREEEAKVECTRANPPKFHPEPGKRPEEIELEGGGAQSREFAGEVLAGRDWRVRELSLSTSETFRPSLGNGRASSVQGHIDSQGSTRAAAMARGWRLRPESGSSSASQEDIFTKATKFGSMTHRMRPGSRCSMGMPSSPSAP